MKGGAFGRIQDDQLTTIMPALRVFLSQKAHSLSEYVYLVLLLKDFEPFAESEGLAEIADKVMQQFDYEVGLFAQDAPMSGDELASLARTEGVRLL